MFFEFGHLALGAVTSTQVLAFGSRWGGDGRPATGVLCVCGVCVGGAHTHTRAHEGRWGG